MPHPPYIPTQSTTLGDFELTVLSDGNYYLDGGAFFGVVPKVMWSKRMPADEQNRLSVGMNSLLIRTGKHTVLVETGAGNKLNEKQKHIYGNQEKLLENLAAAKVAPDDIDIVVNTHLHFDHCGWNTVMKGDHPVATFPKAKYYVQEGEWRHARMQTERDRVSYLSPNYDPLIESGQMHLLHGDSEIVPGISVKVFPGHTRNLQAVMIHSGAHRASYISDLIPTTHHLDLTWVMAFDLFPLETIESRKRFYERAVPDRWLVAFTHDPKTPWAYVESPQPGRLSAVPIR
jgi:glyoxylase-like metal-dependent hydrolase (beta-lactamase superfamily II)